MVVGTRTFDDYKTMCYILDPILKEKRNVVIISGGAKGADSLAEKYAKDHGHELKVFYAEWDKYGKSAGYKRNEVMHKYISQFEKKQVVAFWDGVSKGTAHNFGIAPEYDNPILIYNYRMKIFEKDPYYES